MGVESIASSAPVTFTSVQDTPVSSESCRRAAEDNSGKAADSQAQAAKKPTESEIIDSIQKANKKLEVHGTRLQFSIHEKTKEIMVKIIDTKTDEVIREIPPEKILDMVAKMMEMAGLLVDERA